MKKLTREERKYWRNQYIKAAVIIFGSLFVLAVGLPNWVG